MSVLTERRTAPAAPPVVREARVSVPAAAKPARAPRVRRAHPWVGAFAGFVVGFLAGLLPAAFVTEVLATTLPLGGNVVQGRTATVISLVLTSCVARATAVAAAARAVHRTA